MAETVARRGGIVVIPQDIPLDILKNTIGSVKRAHARFETPITLSPSHTVRDAMGLLYKRAHGAVIVVNENNQPVGIFTESNASGRDMFDTLAEAATSEVECIDAKLTPDEMHEALVAKKLNVAPIVEDGTLVGITTTKGPLQSVLWLRLQSRRFLQQ